MPATDWIPAQDEALDAFAANFSTKITAAPGNYGLVAGDATSFSTLKSDFTTKLATSSAPATRTSVSVAAKNTSRASLVAALRSLARRVQAYVSITAALLAELGLTVRDTVGTPVPAPATKPLVSIANVGSQSFTLNLSDEATPASRRRPTGSIGAQVFYSYGAEPEITDPELMNFAGVATRSRHVVGFPAGAIGQQANIRLRWFNRRGQVGPLSDVITGTVAA